MKILFYLSELNVGGISKVVINLSNSLVKRGYEVFIICKSNKTTFNIDNRISIINEVSISYFSKVVFLRKEIKKINPNIIIGLIHSFFWAYLAKIGLNIPIIASDHASFEYNPTIKSIFIRQYLYRLADSVTILTESDKLFLKNRLKMKFVMPNPVEIPNKIKDINLRKNQIVAVGRFDDWYIKGFDILIKAWSKISFENTNWKLIIFGYGKEENKKFLHNLVSDEKINVNQISIIENVIILDEILQDSKIFVLSSRVEGLPMVLLEAMSNGCACLSTPINGRAFEILGESGKIVFEDVNSMAVGLDELIKSKEMQIFLSNKCFIKVRDYDIETVTDKWIKLFNNLYTKYE